MKFVFITAEKAHYPVRMLCELLEVLRSGYYAWVDRPTAPKVVSDAQLVVEIKAAMSLVVDRETSELVEQSTYQGYGGVDGDYRPERWKSFREDYRFTGKEEDIEVGLQYFGKRLYAPGLGRWVSSDPLAIHSLGADSNVYCLRSWDGALLS